MNRTLRGVWLAAVGGTVLAGGLCLAVLAAERYPKKSKPKTLTADQIIAGLDRILSEQAQVRGALEHMKEELAIIKVRATTPSS